LFVCRAEAAYAAESRRKQILLCAPSNTAVDELIRRMHSDSQLKSPTGEPINVLRLGKVDRIEASAQKYSLDALVNREMATANEEFDRIQDAMDENTSKLRVVEERLHEKLCIGEEALVKLLEKEKNQLVSSRESLRAQLGNKRANVEQRRHDLQRRFLESANVIACTLSGSGLEILKSAQLAIECVIVDEAAQCIEPEVLVPLQYGCRKVNNFESRLFFLSFQLTRWVIVYFSRGSPAAECYRQFAVCRKFGAEAGTF
jgi:senataxin